MKLWEALKALDENPGKVFESDRRTLQADENLIFFQRKHDSGELFSYERIASDWQEVKQPVTWQEAIQAEADGKRVWCEFHNQAWSVAELVVEHQYFKKALDVGKWYVED